MTNRSPVERSLQHIQGEQSDAHDKSAMEIHPQREQEKPEDGPGTISATILLEQPEAAGGEKEGINLCSYDWQKTEPAQINCDGARGSPHLHLRSHRLGRAQAQHTDQQGNQIFDDQHGTASEPVREGVSEQSRAPLMVYGGIDRRRVRENVPRKQMAGAKTLANQRHFMPDVGINEIEGNLGQKQGAQPGVSSPPQPDLPASACGIHG